LNQPTGVLDCRVAFSNTGMLVGAPGPFGPRVALLRGLGMAPPEWALTLGDSDAPSLRPPAVGLVQKGAQAVFVEGGVAKRVALPSGIPRAIAEGVDRVAMATGPSGSVVVTAGASLLLHLPEHDKRPVTLVARCEPLIALEVVTLGRMVLVFYVPEVPVTLGVCRWDGESVREVRHPLSSPCVEIHAQVSGESVGLALGHAKDVIDFARIDIDGQMVERPHPRWRGQGVVLRSPNVLWVESDFALSAVAQGELRYQGLPRSASLSVAGIMAPCRAAYLRSRLVVVGVEMGHAGARLRVFVQDRAGERRENHLHALHPPDQDTRRRRAALRGRLEEWVAQTRAAGRVQVPVRLTDSGLGVWLSVAHRSLRLDFSIREQGVRMHLTVADEEEEEEAPPPEPSLLRLSRWVRRSLGLGERALSSDQEAFAAALVRALPEASLEIARSAGGTLEFEIAMPDLPTLEALLSVLSVCRGSV